MALVRPWLPDDAFGLDAARRALGDALVTWSERWFADERAVLTACAPTILANCDLIKNQDYGGAIAMPPRCGRHLLEAALGIDLGDVELADADRPVIYAFADAVARDLLHQIGIGKAEAIVAEGFSMTLAVGGREILTLILPQDSLAQLLRTFLPKRSQQRAPLVGRLRALGPTSVSLKAILGHGQLTLRELDDMAPGDVILLHRRPTDGADLALAGHSTPIARGSLGRMGDKSSLRL